MCLGHLVVVEIWWLHATFGRYMRRPPGLSAADYLARITLPVYIFRIAGGVSHSISHPWVRYCVFS